MIASTPVALRKPRVCCTLTDRAWPSEKTVYAHGVRVDDSHGAKWRAKIREQAGLARGCGKFQDRNFQPFGWFFSVVRKRLHSWLYSRGVDWEAAACEQTTLSRQGRLEC